MPGYGEAVNEHWVMDLSSNLSNGGATSNIDALTEPGGKSFVAGYAQTSGNQTSAHTLTNAQFSEFEYAVRSTANVTVGTTYCFRLTHAGVDTNFAYTQEPRVAVSAIVDRPQGGGGGGGGGEPGGGYSYQYPTPVGGGEQGGGGGGEAGGGEYPTPYATPQGGGGEGGGGGDTGYLFGESNLASAFKAVTDTMKMINRMFVRD